jgi:hypothetical protein
MKSDVRHGIRVFGTAWYIISAMASVGLVHSAGTTLTIGGTVSRSVAVAVTPEIGLSLNLQAGETDRPVCIVKERSNAPGGCTVTLRSTGAGAGSQPHLKPSGPSGQGLIPYTLKYAGKPVLLRCGTAVLNAPGGTSGAGDNRILSVTVPPAGSGPAGSYHDTLTLTIEGK